MPVLDVKMHFSFQTQAQSGVSKKVPQESKDPKVQNSQDLIYENAYALVPVDPGAFQRMTSQRRSLQNRNLRDVSSQKPRHVSRNLSSDTSSQRISNDVSSQKTPRDISRTFSSEISSQRISSEFSSQNGRISGASSSKSRASDRSIRRVPGTDSDDVFEDPGIQKNPQRSGEVSQPRRRRKRGDRRNTIGGITDKENDPQELLLKEKRIFDDQIIGTKIPYSKSADFPKTKDVNFLSNVKNQFATLRRKSRRKPKDSPLYENLYDMSLRQDPVYDDLPLASCQNLPKSRSYTQNPEESDYSGYNASNSISQSSRSSPVDPDENPKSGTLKKIFRRTLSLRLPKRPQLSIPGSKTEDIYTSIPFKPRKSSESGSAFHPHPPNRQIPVQDQPQPHRRAPNPQSRTHLNPPPIPPKKGAQIPIYHSSQVIQMAAHIHRQGKSHRISRMIPFKKKERSMSIGSAESFG